MASPKATTPMAIHMTSRMRIAQGVPYVEMEITDDAEPTMTRPITHSSPTTTKRSVDVGTVRPAIRNSTEPLRAVSLTRAPRNRR